MQRKERIGAWAAFVMVGSTLIVCPTSLAQSVDTTQERRLRHFDVLRERGFFESMSVVRGIPTLVLGATKDRTDPVSFRAFCWHIYDYYKNVDANYAELRIVDGSTNRLLAVINETGYHDAN
jgi:hypothetical protein